MSGGGRCKILLRADWANMFCILDSENVSSAGEGSDRVKETHCCKSGMEVVFFFGIIIFYFLFRFLLYFMC